MWIGAILSLIGLCIFITGRLVKPYETGEIFRAYSYWISYMDVTEDLDRIAINNDQRTIYVIDHDEKRDRIRYILDKRDFGMEHINLMDVCFGQDGSLFVYAGQTDQFNRGNQADYIYWFDAQGRLQKRFTIDETPSFRRFKVKFGLCAATDSQLTWIAEHEGSYDIMRLNTADGEQKVVKQFSLPQYVYIMNVDYDGDGFYITCNDGTLLFAGDDGSERQIDRFPFEINDEREENRYVDYFVHTGDEFYFLDKKFYNEICTYKDGQIETAFSLDELAGLDTGLKETDYTEYMRSVVNSSFSIVEAHNDILEFCHSGVLYFLKDGELTQIATSDGIDLPLRYSLPALYQNVSVWFGIGLLVLGIGFLIFYIVRYRFTVFYKILLFLVPTVAGAFILITYVAVDQVTSLYFKNIKEEMTAVSSVIASGLDPELIKEVNDLDDVRNGNLSRLEAQFEKLIDDHAEWNGSMIFELSAYNPKLVHYLLVNYPGVEECYLNTFFLRTLDNLEDCRQGESNTYLVSSKTQADYYVDAVTVIYDEGEPIAIMDVYGYQTQINELGKTIRYRVIVIAGLFMILILLVLSWLAHFITDGLEATCRIVEEISEGNLHARVKEISRDEVGVVAQGINEMAQQLETAFESQEEFAREVIETLVGTIDAKDKYTNGHSMRVARYAKEIAKRIGKSEKEQNTIYYAGLLHDIGKIGVPDEIINKTSRLDADEYALVKKHPELGHDLLKNLSRIEHIDVGAYGHHERYDGGGYPQGLTGEEIPELARIIGVADAYDAMTSNRSYRNAMSQEKVREEIQKGIGSQFDPDFAKIMLEIDEEIADEVYVCSK